VSGSISACGSISGEGAHSEWAPHAARRRSAAARMLPAPSQFCPACCLSHLSNHGSDPSVNHNEPWPATQFLTLQHMIHLHVHKLECDRAVLGRTSNALIDTNLELRVTCLRFTKDATVAPLCLCPICTNTFGMVTSSSIIPTSLEGLWRRAARITPTTEVRHRGSRNWWFGLYTMPVIS